MVHHVPVHLDHCTEKFAADCALEPATLGDTFHLNETLCYSISDMAIFSCDAFSDVELRTEAVHVVVVDVVPQNIAFFICISICKLIATKPTSHLGVPEAQMVLQVANFLRAQAACLIIFLATSFVLFKLCQRKTGFTDVTVLGGSLPTPVDNSHVVVQTHN